MNIVDAFLDQVFEHPSQAAVIDGERVISYSMLAAMVDHAAAQLRARAIGAGDIVVVSLRDTAEHVATLLALAKIGAVSLSIDPEALEVDKQRAVRDLKMSSAIVDAGAEQFLAVPTFPVGALFERTDDTRMGAPAPQAPDAFNPDSPLMIIQSSGTTGEPKRLSLTHRHMMDRNQRDLAVLGLTAADCYLQVPYLRFYCGRENCFRMLRLGATVVMNHASSIAEYARYFSDFGITFTYFTPYHLRSLLAEISGNLPLWPKLKIILGMAPSTPDERRVARQRLTPQIFVYYGVNEVGPLVICTPADQAKRSDSVGRPLDGIEAQVIDRDGHRLAPGQVGLIGFRGPYLPHQYLGNAEATQRHFKDSWFYPGDLAAIDREGFVFLKGRADDVINNAGSKYFPAEVEAVLLSHPAVADVAVIGGPHDQFGEVTVAYAVLIAPATPNELYEFCDGKIADYKAPHWVFFLDEIPRSAVGKPDKKKLKKMFRRYLETETH